jgi:hypothetical protein
MKKRRRGDRQELFILKQRAMMSLRHRWTKPESFKFPQPTLAPQQQKPWKYTKSWAVSPETTDFKPLDIT